MLLPETVPVYVTTPTAPKLMALPDRVPLMWRVSWGDERTMVPSTFDPVWVHARVKVPLNGPLYCPDQLPVTATVAGGRVAAAVGVGVGAAVAAVVGGAVWAVLGVGVPAGDDEPQAAITMTVAPVRATSAVLNISGFPFCGWCVA
jgi:hypothetical protein